MHLKLLVFLAFVAFCGAKSLGDHEYFVDVEDNHVAIRRKDGREIEFHCGGWHDQRHIKIRIDGPDLIKKTYEISDHKVGAGKYQSDLLHHIFSKYSGPTGEEEFKQLLHDISKHVEEDEVHPVVLHALHHLSRQHDHLLGKHSYSKHESFRKDDDTGSSEEKFKYFDKDSRRYPYEGSHRDGSLDLWSYLGHQKYGRHYSPYGRDYRQYPRDYGYEYTPFHKFVGGYRDEDSLRGYHHLDKEVPVHHRYYGSHLY